MRNTRFKPLVEKSVQAAVSALEIYNRPSFKYREENFAILFVNAWELMLKACLVQQHKSMLCIYKFKSTNEVTNRRRLKREIDINRSGTPKTISIHTCMEKCLSCQELCFEESISVNINQLIEIRDSAVHFTNSDKLLSKRVHEISVICLKNYVKLLYKWFQYDLSKYNFYLMPLSFFQEYEFVNNLNVGSRNTQANILIKYLNAYDKVILEMDKNNTLTIKHEVELRRSNSTEAVSFSVNPQSQNSVRIELSEKDFFEKYKWTYARLLEKLKRRYSDFKQNRHFNDIMKQYESNDNYVGRRINNKASQNPVSTKWYSPNIFNVLDRHYSERKSS